MIKEKIKKVTYFWSNAEMMKQKKEKVTYFFLMT